MPNWAIGTVAITGKKNSIKRFVSRFIYDDHNSKEGKKETHHFARSFCSGKKVQTINEVSELFQNITEDIEQTFYLHPQFAWSATSCIINGYPQRWKECVTLAEACQKDKVSVKIETEECGNCFEEHIFCDADGCLEEESFDLKPYLCSKCKHVEHIASFHDIDDYDCCECGEIDWRRLGA